MEQFTTACLVGQAYPDKWSQAYISSNFFIVVEISNQNAILAGKLFLEKISAYDLQNVHNLKDFKNFLNSVSFEINGITYTAGIIIDKVLYAKVSGSGKLYLKRKAKIAGILEGDGVVSGKLKPNDMIFLESSSFSLVVPQIDTITAFDETGPAQVTEILAPKLHSQNSVSAAFIAFSFESNKFSYRPLFKLKPEIINSLKNKKPLLLVSGLFLLLIVSITVGVFNNQKNQQTNLQKQNLDLIKHQYDEGVSLIDLNPTRARDLLKEAKANLLSYKSENDRDMDKIAAGLSKEIDEAINAALKKYDIVLSTFYDLNLVKNGGEGERLSLAKDVMYVLDKKNGLIYSINVSQKSTKIMAGGDILKQAKALSGNSDDFYILSGDIYKVANGGTLSPSIKNESNWGEAADIAYYAGNIYLLDSGSKQIWKYQGTDAGFSGPIKYLRSDTTADFNKDMRLDINGSIWVTGQGNILRFTQGVVDTWQIKDTDEKLGSNLQIFISDETTNLYILDLEAKKIIVTDKNGAYNSQYVWQDQFIITDFAVSEKIKKILLLSRDKIYSIDIK